MSYVVRKVGGGSFNPKAMAISADSSYLFIGCGCQINVYRLPELSVVQTITTHKAHVMSIVCSEEEVISGDSEGHIYWHKLNGMTVVENSPSKSFDCEYPIERLIYRAGKLFYIYFTRRLFWVLEHENEENSIFRVDTDKQKTFLKKLHPGVVLPGVQPLRFSTLDGFDINEEATTAVIADKCKLHIYNFETGKGQMYPNQLPIQYARFRKNQVVAFLANGMMFIYDEMKKTPVRDHWHYACPNAFATTETSVISGGFEGVLTFYNEKIVTLPHGI